MSHGGRFARFFGLGNAQPNGLDPDVNETEHQNGAHDDEFGKPPVSSPMFRSTGRCSRLIFPLELKVGHRDNVGPC
jgi:hypothetical protein